jgi:hypothetical protein
MHVHIIELPKKSTNEWSSPSSSIFFIDKTRSKKQQEYYFQIIVRGLLPFLGTCWKGYMEWCHGVLRKERSSVASLDNFLLSTCALKVCTKIWKHFSYLCKCVWSEVHSVGRYNNTHASLRKKAPNLCMIGVHTQLSKTSLPTLCPDSTVLFVCWVKLGYKWVFHESLWNGSVQT